MDQQKGITRRRLLKTATVTGAALAGAPYVQTSYSAGKLSIAAWDHWVPGANDASRQVIEAWGKKNRVDVTVDYVTSIGQKLILTAAAEERAKTGHDIIALSTWYTAIHNTSLEPVNDVVDELKSQYGEFVDTAYFLNQFDGQWLSLPVSIGSQSYPMVSRLDLFQQYAGVDLRKIFPADKTKRDPALVAAWNYDNFLTYCQKLYKAGYPFGNPIGPTSDSQDWTGPLFLSFGAMAVDKDGNITVDTDEMRMALEYMKKLTQAMPPDVYAWDDAGNNRWIISGKGSSIQNPPSAWTVAKRDRPEVAAQLWHHDTPHGPNGRYRGSLPYSWGLWNFSSNKSAAKDLMLHIGQKEQVFRLLTAAQGFDLPQQPVFYDHPVWAEIGPPVGGQYNYPVRGDETLIVAGYPAPVPIAAQIYSQGLIPNMVARVTQANESLDDAIRWAENEVEGFLRG